MTYYPGLSCSIFNSFFGEEKCVCDPEDLILQNLKIEFLVPLRQRGNDKYFVRKIRKLQMLKI